jgi:D-threo-aldose 1-dehydrogenase
MLATMGRRSLSEYPCLGVLPTALVSGCFALYDGQHVFSHQSMKSPAFLPCTDGARLGLGGAPLGNLFEAISDGQARAVVDAAWADGCRSFDTAPHYGHGLSERRLGDALRGHPRSHLSLSSKVGRLLTPQAQVPHEQHSYVNTLPFVQHWDVSASGVRRSVEDSLQRLGLAQLDAVYIHDVDADTQGPNAAAVLRQVLEEALPELAKLKQAGLISHIGLGVNDHEIVEQVLRHADLDVLMLAGRYTLLDQAALPTLMPQLVTRQVALALGGVFNSGILATRVGTDRPMTFNYAPAAQVWVDKALGMQRVCDEHGVSLPAAAVQFALAHPATQIVMLGVRSADQWQAARQAEREVIPTAFWQQLRHEGWIPAEAPIPGETPWSGERA